MAAEHRVNAPFPAVEGGWRIKTWEQWHVDVLQMGFNWRIAIMPIEDDTSYVRGWCYPKELHSLHLVNALAVSFNPDAGEEPVGWIKEAGTERRACNGYYPHPNNRHNAYDPDCPYCAAGGPTARHRTITCPECGMTSQSHADVEYGWCGTCEKQTWGGVRFR